MSKNAVQPSSEDDSGPGSVSEPNSDPKTVNTTPVPISDGKGETPAVSDSAPNPVKTADDARSADAVPKPNCKDSSPTAKPFGPEPEPPSSKNKPDSKKPPITTQPTSGTRRSSLKPQVPNNSNSESKPKKRVSFTPEYTPKPENKPAKPNEGSPKKPDQNANNNNNNSPDGVITKQPKSKKPKSSKVAPVQDPFTLLKPLEGVSAIFFKRCYEPIAAQAKFSEESFKFNIFDACGNRLLIAAELGKCCPICYCLTDRCFKFLILNPEGETLFIVKRSCGCCCCCGTCFFGDTCGQSVKVELEGGMPLGEVTQLCRCCRPTYVIKNSLGAKVFRLRGPCCGFCFCCRICCAADFSLQTFEPLQSTKKRAKLGRVSMNWDEIAAPAVADGFVFGVSFPTDLDVRLKATLLGATILIDFLHYEKDPCGPSQFCC